MLVLSSFIVIALSLLGLAFIKLIQANREMVFLQTKQLQADMLARAGLEDAVFEIKHNVPWDLANLSPTWSAGSVSQFYKSTVGPVPLDHFDYPATFSVTVSPTDNYSVTVSILSEAEVGDPVRPERFKSALQAEVIRSMAGEVFVTEAIHP